jgi:heptosyltransferase-2
LGKKPILLIQTAFLGDLLLAIPLMNSIRLAWPEHPLHLVCRKGVGDLFLRLHLVDQIFEVKKGDSQSYQDVLSHLQEQSYEVLLCPHQSLRSSRLAKKIHASLKIGFYSWWNFLVFGQRIKKDLSLPEALRQLSLLTAGPTPIAQELKKKISSYARDTAVIPDWAHMSVAEKIDRKDAAKILEVHAVSGPYVTLFPGSVWATKQWTKNGFIEAGRELQKQGYRILVLGGPGEEQLGGEVAGAIPSAVNLVAQTRLHETLAILSQAELVISNDSAGQHLAAAADVPTVSIFGPTTLNLGFRPWNRRARVVERVGLACRPCGKHGHQVCPIGTHECMKSISSQEVLKQAAQLIPRR